MNKNPLANIVETMSKYDAVMAKPTQIPLELNKMCRNMMEIFERWKIVYNEWFFVRIEIFPHLQLVHRFIQQSLSLDINNIAQFSTASFVFLLAFFVYFFIFCIVQEL